MKVLSILQRERRCRQNLSLPLNLRIFAGTSLEIVC